MNLNELNPLISKHTHGLTDLYKCIPTPPAPLEMSYEDLVTYCVAYIQNAPWDEVERMIYSLSEVIKEYVYARSDVVNIDLTDNKVLGVIIDKFNPNPSNSVISTYRKQAHNALVQGLIRRVRKQVRNAWVASKGYTEEYNEDDLMNWIQNVVFHGKMMDLESLQADIVADQKLRMIAADKLANYMGLNDRTKEVSLNIKLPEPPPPTRKQVEAIPLKQLHIEEIIEEVIDEEDEDDYDDVESQQEEFDSF